MTPSSNLSYDRITQRHNENQILNTQNTSIFHPHGWTMRFLLWGFWREIDHVISCIKTITIENFSSLLQSLNYCCISSVKEATGDCCHLQLTQLRQVIAGRACSMLQTSHRNKKYHFDEILIIGYSESCLNDNFWYIQWRKFCENDISVSLFLSTHSHELSHWGQVMHICIGNLAIIWSDNGFSPGRCQAIIWTNDGILLIGPLGTNFSEILIIFIQENAFQSVVCEMAAILSRPQCVKVDISMVSRDLGLHHCHWSSVPKHGQGFKFVNIPNKLQFDMHTDLYFTM